MPKRKGKTKVMFLETRLDQDLSSSRSQLLFMKEFFRPFESTEIVPCEVHSRSDLRKFCDVARMDESIKALHIVAHGERTREESAIILTADERVDLNLPKNQSLFKGLGVEAVFLSCCQLGSDRDLMRKLLKVSGVDAVFSYGRDVTDYQAFVIESLFYHLAYGDLGKYFISPSGDYESLSWDEVYNRLVLSSYTLGIDFGKRLLQSPLLVAEFEPEIKQRKVNHD